MNLAKAIKTWNRNAPFYDLMNSLFERWGKSPRIKKEMISQAKGRVLEVGIGTGNSICYYPPGLDIAAIDISSRMLGRARKKGASYPGALRLELMDVEKLGFRDNSFDTVVATCVFCSVPDPVAGLKEVARVLKPGGRLLLFEHVLSKDRVAAWMMNLLSPLFSWLFGPHLNRDTVGNVSRAGLRVIRDEGVMAGDIFRRIDAVKEGL